MKRRKTETMDPAAIQAMLREEGLCDGDGAADGHSDDNGE
jgi:hypothetical protein